MGESGSFGAAVAKVATGIRGFDTVTDGGVPAARATLVAGGAGCGKTLFGMEFLLHGANGGEPGVLFALEERERDIAVNARALGFDLAKLVANDLLRVDDIYFDAAAQSEVGEWSLDALLTRMEREIAAIGAKRVVIDTIETLFCAFDDHAQLRREIVRLVRRLKELEVTAVITAESGERSLSRRGVEEYVSDCVIVLDHRIDEQVSTRRLRIVKYRGSSHGTNEYPFLIDERGLSIQPITSVALDYEVSEETVSSGVPDLDRMLDGRGYFRGSTVLLSGTAGAGKTSIALSAVRAAAAAGERALVFAFEESPSQIRRNMRSIGLDLAALETSGRLLIRSTRPTVRGLEPHLLEMIEEVERFEPRLVVVDPISSFSARDSHPVEMLLVRLIDALKSRGVTALMTYLADHRVGIESTVEGVSSLTDTWVLLRAVEREGRRRRSIHVLKARGMNHSDRVGELVLAEKGISIRGPSE